MSVRLVITDAMWDRIRPLMPADPVRGRRWADNRRTLPSDQVGHRLRRGRLGGRPPGFDSEAYKQRNTVERCINRPKQWRGLATRTDELAIAYQAAHHLAGILMDPTLTKRTEPSGEQQGWAQGAAPSPAATRPTNHGPTTPGIGRAGRQ